MSRDKEVENKNVGFEKPCKNSLRKRKQSAIGGLTRQGKISDFIKLYL
jgi:hypothetical protein